MNEHLKLGLRLAVLAIVVELVQVTAVSQLSVFGVTVDLTPLLVVFVAVLCGSAVGAATGFLVGLGVDVVLLQALGVSSLIYLGIGYGAGRISELRNFDRGPVSMVAGGLATLMATVGFTVIQFLLGAGIAVSWERLRQISVAVVIGALLGPLFFALVRRVLRPALDTSSGASRRRAYTTGGLSPLSGGRS